LNRSRRRSPWKRWVSSYVYTHVTGHGLCVRLSLLHDIPFPGQSPLEDMHYSFILGSRGIPMEPVHSLDRADVPLSLRLQVEQAARWFYGPGRFLEYLRDPQTARGPRAYVLALSALAICAEWLSCAVLPPSLLLLLWRAPTLLRATAGAFVLVYASQLVASDLLLGASCAHPARLARLVGYPVNCALFGVGGWIGASRLLRRDTNSGKTERCIG
jgi:hypothetical protein